MKEEFLKAIEEARAKSKKRNFVQTFDLIVNLKEIDVKKPENRIIAEVELPHGKGKDSSIAIFADSIKGLDVEIIPSKKIEAIKDKPREIRKLARRFDFFFAEPQLMPLIGKYLGKYFGPTGKMPKVIRGDIKRLIEIYKKCVRIKVKEAPVVQCAVGNEKMSNDEIAENAVAVMNFLKEKLPKGERNIGKVFIKLTMGKPVEVSLKW